MKLYRKCIVGAVVCCLAILLESCSYSVLVDEWTDPSYHESPLKKMLVIAVRKDPVRRRIWEDAFVDELSQYGVIAISSYNLFPNVLPDTNQIAETVQEKGFDGILVNRVLDKETETHYVESHVTTETKTRYNSFRNTYFTYYQDVQHPGYVDSQIVHRGAIEIWAVKDNERIIWAATSNTPEMNSAATVQKDIANLVIHELLQKAVIKSEK
jgi:hypothetical protein